MATRTSVIHVKVSFSPDAAKLFKGKTINVIKVGPMTIEATIPFDPGDLDSFAEAQRQVVEFRAEVSAMAVGNSVEVASRITTTADEVPAFTAGDDGGGQE